MKKIIFLVLFTLGLHQRALAQNYASNWEPLGPIDMPTYETSMGRVNCITALPGSPNRLFIGTPDGGVWRSDNGGATWLPRTDFLPVLGVSSLVIDPVNTNTIYIATGDADGRGLLQHWRLEIHGWRHQLVGDGIYDLAVEYVQFDS